jgi:hypothetical protein
MRITLLASFVLASITTTAAAQTTYVGPWQPRSTIGGAIGRLSAGETSATWKPLLSGTVEIPITGQGRIRIEAGRSSFPHLFAANLASRDETARLFRVSVGGAALIKPGAPISPYVGGSLGVYRLSVDNGLADTVTGGNLYGGAEIMASDRISIDAEIGVHLIDQNLFNERLFADLVLRIKVGL